MLDFRQEFENEKAKILANNRLSETGKQEKIKELRNQYEAEAKALKNELRKNAVMFALALKDAQAEQAEHLAAQHDDFDYARLNYEAQAVKAKIANLDSIHDVQAAWEQAKKAGDLYAIKAWKDTAGEPLARFDDGEITKDKRDLLADMAKTSTDRPDPEIAERERDHLEELQRIETDANEIDDFLDAGSFVKRGGIKRAVFNGIEFDGGAIKTDFDYQDHPILDRKESAAEVADRVADQAAEDAEAMLEVGRQFGVELDPDLDLAK